MAYHLARLLGLSRNIRCKAMRTCQDSGKNDNRLDSLHNRNDNYK
jgi:hypothetical protein